MDSSWTSKPFARLFAAILVCGPLYGFAVFSYLMHCPLWLISVLIVGGITLPVLWVLLPELRQHGLHGISVARFLLVFLCFTAGCIASFFVFSAVVVALWPYLDLPPMPSD